ncbi:hypothetical protein E3C22_01250 [Jiella endophytica]|uniref:Thermonuclease family protein n=1 Tax=Jiella endophytica TaxID=2558362 RepID=A0A4Y8RTJ6_9HYPH|nr:hypothetical protein [Jiella endophytica]TFF27137.1 hypothetical protein E3C22_01250 [Jiella endophytica]
MRLAIEDVRRTIVVAVALVLVFWMVLWLAPAKDGRHTVFDPAPQPPVTTTAATGSEKPARTTARPEDAALSETSEDQMAVRSIDGEDLPGSSGPSAPLERLPPRPPLSEAKLRPDTPKPRLLPRPVALDGARIAYRQGVITLPGVEALPLAERCGPDEGNFPCGVMARTELRRFLRGRSIACDVPQDFGLKRGEATSACTVADEDIGRWVVENGWAKAAPGGPYEKAEAAAKEAKRGLWR